MQALQRWAQEGLAHCANQTLGPPHRLAAGLGPAMTVQPSLFGEDDAQEAQARQEDRPKQVLAPPVRISVAVSPVLQLPVRRVSSKRVLQVRKAGGEAPVDESRREAFIAASRAETRRFLRLSEREQLLECIARDEDSLVDPYIDEECAGKQFYLNRILGYRERLQELG